MVSTAKVSQFLEGLVFPASKEQIINYVRDNNAPQDVLNVLEKMPDGKYYSTAAVLDSLSRAA